MLGRECSLLHKGLRPSPLQTKYDSHSPTSVSAIGESNDQLDDRLEAKTHEQTESMTPNMFTDNQREPRVSSRHAKRIRDP